MAGAKINTTEKPQTQKWMFKCQPYQFSGTSEKHFSATLPLPCTATKKPAGWGKGSGWTGKESQYDYTH